MSPLPACRAAAQVDGTLAVRLARKCKDCGDVLPAIFFSQGAKSCRTCRSAYGRRRRASALRPQPVAEKVCESCRLRMPASQYTPELLNPTGLRSWCKKCSKRRKQEYLALNAAAPLPAAALAPTKTCTICKRDQPRAAFHAKSGSWDGLIAVCRSCTKERGRKWAAAARERSQAPASAAQL